jgi:hypothetical protein
MNALCGILWSCNKISAILTIRAPIQGLVRLYNEETNRPIVG